MLTWDENQRIYQELTMEHELSPTIEQLVKMRSFIRTIENKLNNKINLCVIKWRNEHANIDKKK